MPKEKFDLNTSQKKAINFDEGQLLVVAGAGTGKTRVITERIKRLVEKEGVKPKEILALTFTEKAAQEMLTRVGDAMPLGYEEPYISTFHSFADRILRTEGLEIGLDTSYKILNDPARWILFRQNLFDFDLKYFRPLGNPTKFISAILKFISRLQDENILPADFKRYADKFEGDTEEKARWHELAGVYQKYEELKIQKSKLDFGDLIIWLIKLFKERPNILKKYQKQFKHVLVDEFQDTNYAQYDLVKMLCPQEMPERSLMVVGDDNQAIYRFRGAAVSNILEFKVDCPETEMVTLKQNYRSNQAILDSSYKLIQNNNPDTLESKLGISKKLVSEINESPVKPNVFQVESLEDEVELVITKILEVLAEEPQYTYKDFAVLARANSHLDPFVMALKKYGIPYQLLGNRGLYDQEEIRDVLSLLRVIVDSTDSISLYRAQNIGVFNIPHDEILRVLNTAKYQKVSLWHALSFSTNENIVNLIKKLNEFKTKIVKSTPSEFIYEVINSTGYLKPLITEETLENELKVKNLDFFLSIVKRFEVEFRADSREIPTIIDALEYLDLMIEAGDNPAQAEIEDIDTVNLLTIHGSKGLEFPVVFMVNLVSDRFPTRDRQDQIPIPEDLIKEILPEGDPHIQEERRLFYVGMTRAKKYLFLISAKNYGGKREKNPSGFIEETKLKTEEIESSEINKNRTRQTDLFGVDSEFRKTLAHKVSKFVPDNLSYTQISTYEKCPLQYKYAHVLKIPTPTNHSLSFGITIHNTLRDFHNKLIFGETVTLETMLKIYEDHWQPFGYKDEAHKIKRFEDGKRILADYYKQNCPVKVKPLALEKTFTLKIDGTKFFGRIDRIDPLSDGGVEIIDYKTGNSKTQKEVDKDDQMTFYAIGAVEALGYEPKLLSLYYLESGEKIATTRTKAELEKKKEKVIEVINKMRAGEFTATPGKHCNYCDYKNLCPFVYKV